MIPPSLLAAAALLAAALGDSAPAQAAADTTTTTPPPAQPAKPTPPAAQASAPAGSPPATMPRVEITGEADSDETLRRRQSVAMSVYGREELDRQGDIDVTDVLKRLPGVSMDGGAPRLRGLAGGYTQLLINGEPAPPGFSLDSVAPGDVERIEVVKGATAEHAGVAGTINIVLREPPRTRQREWRGNLNQRAVQPGASSSFQWGDRIGGLSFVVPVSLARSAQATRYEQARISRSKAGQIQAQDIAGRDEGRSVSAQIAPRLQWKFTPMDTLNLGAFAQRGESRSRSERRIDTRQGTPWLTVADSAESQSQADVYRLNAQWQQRQADGGKFELNASWQDTRRAGFSHYLGWRQNASILTDRDTRSEFEESRSSAGGRWTQPVGDAHTLLAGWLLESRDRDELRRVWDFGRERQDSATGLPFTATSQRAAVFVQDDWTISPQWGLQPGLRLEQLHTHIEGNRYTQPVDNRARVIAPTVHLNYRFDPKGRDQIRASLTRSFKQPDLNAMVSRYVLNGNYEHDITNTPIAADSAGNPGLRPERASGLDLHFEHYPAGGGVFSIGAFYRRIDDLVRRAITLEDGSAPDITSVPRWVSRPVNLGRAVSRGIELEIKGRAEDWLPKAWLPGPDSGLNLRAAWNFYRSEVEQVDGPDNRLEAQPPWLATMGFDWRIPATGWTLGASLVMQPGFTTQQTDRQLSRRSATRNLDAFAAWKVDRSTQLRLGLSNLLARDTEIASGVADLDGFSAGSTTRRETLRTVSLSGVFRF